MSGPLPKQCRARLVEVRARAEELKSQFCVGNRGHVAARLAEMDGPAALAVLACMMESSTIGERHSIRLYFEEVA